MPNSLMAEMLKSAKAPKEYIVAVQTLICKPRIVNAST